VVTAPVAVGVVEELEVVDIGQQHRHRPVRPPRRLDRLVEGLLDAAVGEHPGQPVGVGPRLRRGAEPRPIERLRALGGEVLGQPHFGRREAARLARREFDQPQRLAADHQRHHQPALGPRCPVPRPLTLAEER
jgi:hypothetical protein